MLHVYLKKTRLLLLCLFWIAFSWNVHAQNTPCAAIALPNDMPDFQTYSTSGLSNSGIPDPGCAAPITVDIWFAVVAPPSGDMDIATLAGTMGNAAMAFYSGPCSNPMLIACTDDDICGNTIMPIMQFDNLIPGQTYYIRIWPEGGGGSFEIRVTDGDPNQPPITLQPTGSASQTGPSCIQLTSSATGQAGCAWDPTQVDFSMPFTNTMILNFGTVDGNGADGICMVYQNDPAGLNACGVTGGSIGAGTIQNSFIIEFDTWDNGAPADTPADHISVNVNGIMTAPINGPVTLPNIEDGQDHEVTFTWNPVGNSYQIFFDGIPYLSGSYDVINNCFGGLTTAWCGFTSSTGAATNTHTICTPGPDIYPAGNETEVDAEICEGEFYFAGGTFQTTSGTYFDLFPAYNGCDSIIITNLTVHPSSNETLSEVLCAGECLTVGPNTFCNSGNFQVTLDNYLGCDSNVFVNLTILDPFAFIAPPETLDCNTAVVSLNGTGSLVGPGVTYQWTGPAPGCIQSDPTGLLIDVICPGTYTLEVSQLISGVECSVMTSVEVVQDIETIDVMISAPPEIDCTNPCINLDASGSTSGPGYTYTWTGPPPFSSNELNPTVCESGTYSLVITNPANGCLGGASIDVLGNASIPIAEAGMDTLLNCVVDSLTLDGTGSSTGSEYTYQWEEAGGAALGTDLQQVINAAGTYILSVQDTTNGCTTLDTVVVSQDLNAPTADAGPDQTLDCNVAMATLDGSNSDSGPTIQYAWIDPDGMIIGSNPMQDISEPGTYILEITDQSNGCTDSSQVIVFQDLNAPVSDAGLNDTLNCTIFEILLDGSGSSVGPEYIYTWLDPGGIILGNDPLQVIDQPGDYTLTVFNTDNNCVDSSVVTVALDTLAPIADSGPGITLTCTDPSGIIGDSIYGMDPNLLFFWEDENGSSQGNTSAIQIDQAGWYFLEVINNQNQCTQIDSVLVQEDMALPNADAGPDGTITCIQTDFELDGSNSDQGVPYSYTWEDENGQNISTDLQFVVNVAGTYTLTTLNTANGCSSTDVVVVSEDLALPTADPGQDATLTCASPLILLDGSNSQPANLEYSWEDPNAIPISNLDTTSISIPGDYTLIVTNPLNGCSDTSAVSIDQDIATPVSDAGLDQVLDCLANSVSLDGSGSSSGANISYSWENGNGSQVGTDPVIDVSEADQYTLIVTNTDNGCTSESQVMVDLDANAPVADAGANATLTCTIAQVDLDGSNSTSGPGIVLDWLDEQGMSIGQDPMQTVDFAGSFTLVVTDQNNGCVSESTVEVLLDTLSPMVDPGLGFTIDCDTPDGILGGTGTSTGPEYAYNWVDGLGNPVGQATTLSVNTPGTYTLEVNNLNNECSAQAMVTVLEDLAIPNADAGLDVLLNCTNPTNTLDGSNSSQGPSITLTWEDENGQDLGNTPTLPITDPGVYFLLVDDQNNGCDNQDTVVVTADFQEPSVDAGLDVLLNCFQAMAELDGSNSSNGPNFVYTWFDENGMVVGNDPMLPVDMDGNYTLEIQNTDNGCIANDNATVSSDFDQPLAEAGANQVLNCFQPDLTLNGNGSSIGIDITYEWQDGLGQVISNGILADIQDADTYTIIVTDQGNGCSSMDLVEVTADFDVPTADAGLDQIIDCIFTDATLDGSASSSGIDFSYQWLDASGDEVSDQSIFTTDASGVYELIVLDLSNGCQATDTAEITIDQDLPIVNLISDDILTCVDLEATLDANGSSVGLDLDYQWNTISGGSISVGADPVTAMVSEPGIYELVITNQDNGCTESAQLEIEQNIIPPVADAGDGAHLNCFQDEALLSGLASAGQGGLTFSWSTIDGIIQGGQQSAQAEVIAGGTYTLIVTDQLNGCTDEDEVEVTSSILESFVFEVQEPICFGDFGSLSIGAIEGGVPPFVYSIDGGAAFSSQSQYNALAAGTYDLAIQDADGCVLETQALIPSPQEVTVTTDAELVLNLGESAILQGITNLTPGEIGSILWSPAEGLSCTNCLDPTVDIVDEMIYTLLVTDQNGCAAETKIVVKVNKQIGIYAPNIFSPNNDGLNDHFLLFADNTGIEEIGSFLIFSRWGEKVFEAYQIQPNDPAYGWDGNYRNEAMDPGVFVWWAEVQYIDGRKELIKGSVTLVR